MLAREIGCSDRGTIVGGGGPAGGATSAAGLSAERNRKSFENENKDSGNRWTGENG
jgi:hypothetical protein